MIAKPGLIYLRKWKPPELASITAIMLPEGFSGKKTMDFRVAGHRSLQVSVFLFNRQNVFAKISCSENELLFSEPLL